MQNLVKKRLNHNGLKWIAAIITVGVLLAGCGVKAPPVPPDLEPPPAAADLGYTLESDGSVVLSWRLDGTERPRGARVQGARIFRSKDALDSPACGDCPRIYTMAKDLSLEKGNMFYREPLQKGFRYYYKIVIYDEGNLESADSNVVSFEYP